MHPTSRALIFVVHLEGLRVCRYRFIPVVVAPYSVSVALLTGRLAGMVAGFEKGEKKR